MSISDRVTDDLAWDSLSLAQWYALISEMIRSGDLEAIPKVLALMAVYGYPGEADEVRRLVSLASKVGGSDG